MTATKGLIEKNLAAAVDPAIARSLVASYGVLMAKQRRRDLDGCLNEAGKFVEHTLRAVEFIRTGTAPAEIKNVSTTVKEIEKDAALPEALRILVPRVAQALVYDVRSKRGAAHVKEIDPRYIDTQLAAQAASWVMAELIRLYHVDSEAEVVAAMGALVRAKAPMVEVFDGEAVVTSTVPCEVELMLLVAESGPEGLDRRALGASSKYSASAVTRAVQRLEQERQFHKTKDGRFHLTGPGEVALAGRAPLPLGPSRFRPV